MSLADLRPGVDAVIEALELAESDAHRLMILGFIPGAAVGCSGRSPLGGPAIYRIDGSEIALRLETARHIAVRPASPPAGRRRPEASCDNDPDRGRPNDRPGGA